MRLRFLVLLAFFALATASSPAQLGIYGNFDATHLTNNQSLTWLYGPNFGAYYNFIHAGPIAAGLDARGNFLFGNHLKYRSGLVGVRVAINPPVLPIKPYAQFSVGGGAVRPDSSGSIQTHYTTKFQYGVFGGADITVLPHVDFRLIEVGYARMTGINGGPVAPATSLVTIGSGIVIRLP
ncbi:hypothetical protein GCM10011507_09770 [Edaphobacter acidisoli]|uniref:Outer membrane protein beta-barrel domain-containing protein n=1 Tax=Edaphobacter acidisoli TaxID=2040573 RepID=A0A916W1L9_9BACT|nr:outer membrane beta-barrel protein [Edaphobacter acidisoli]GGA60255.1 hypothetical protein GCM10011507_09770 [Edaphobacter acidisoli]